MSRSIRCPAETKTGFTPSRVRSTAPSTWSSPSRSHPRPRRVDQRRPVTPLSPGGSHRPTSGVLPTPNDGQPGEHTEVAGQPEPPRVGQPVPVADQHVRPHRQPVERLQQRRHLPEREQSRHVAERRPAEHDRGVHARRGSPRRAPPPRRRAARRPRDTPHPARPRWPAGPGPGPGRPGTAGRPARPSASSSVRGQAVGGSVAVGGRSSVTGEPVAVHYRGRRRSAPSPAARCSRPSRWPRPRGRRRCP